MARRCTGFTLAELIAVIAIAAIVAVVAVSRLSGTFARTRSFYDQAAVAITHARKVAVAQRRSVFVRVDASAGTVTLCYNAGGACSPVQGPAGQSPFTVTAASGTTIAPTVTFQFDGLGQYLTSAGATPGGSLALSVAGDGAYTITVERNTGYVH